jgi:hypothetical protein
MPLRMKALRTFRGRPMEGRPQKGKEFDCEDTARANELEAHGLAKRVDVKAVAPPLNKMEPPPFNKSESSSHPGGGTGAVTSESLSVPARRPRTRRLPLSPRDQESESSS